MEVRVATPYDLTARKRPVNLSLNEDLVRRVRTLTGNLSEEVERLLAAHLEAELARRSESEGTMARALEAWNDLDARVGSFADEHSTRWSRWPSPSSANRWVHCGRRV